MAGNKVARMCKVGDLSPLSLSEFRQYLEARHVAESLRAIGDSLGVTHVSVMAWLAGTRVPSATVRLLARHLAGRDAGTWPLGQAEPAAAGEDLSSTAR